VKVRDKEEQAVNLATALDNALSIPGLRTRVGIDPLVGLVPIVGDVIVTIAGAAILIIARQLQVPWDVQLRMSYNLFKNGLIGSVPFVGDAYSSSSRVINSMRPCWFALSSAVKTGNACCRLNT